MLQGGDGYLLRVRNWSNALKMIKWSKIIFYWYFDQFNILGIHCIHLESNDFPSDIFHHSILKVSQNSKLWHPHSIFIHKSSRSLKINISIHPIYWSGINLRRIIECCLKVKTNIFLTTELSTSERKPLMVILIVNSWLKIDFLKL